MFSPQEPQLKRDITRAGEDVRELLWLGTEAIGLAHVTSKACMCIAILDY